MRIHVAGAAFLGVVCLMLVLPAAASIEQEGSTWEPYRRYDYHNETVVIQLEPGDYQFVWQGLGPAGSQAVMHREARHPFQFELFRAGGTRVDVTSSESISLRLEGEGRGAFVSNDFVREKVEGGTLHVQLDDTGHFAFAIEPAPASQDICVRSAFPVLVDVYEVEWANTRLESDSRQPTCINVETGFEPVHMFLSSPSHRGVVTVTIGEQDLSGFPFVPWVILGVAAALVLVLVVRPLRRPSGERRGKDHPPGEGLA